ncbi:MAG: hypothetical protein IPH80_21205 [Myxococcales bacterium]|nr:hypothetical protein [Myxococcales bacterium]
MANGTTDNTAVNRLIDLAQQRPVEADDTLFESQKRIPLPPPFRARGASSTMPPPLPRNRAPAATRTDLHAAAPPAPVTPAAVAAPPAAPTPAVVAAAVDVPAPRASASVAVPSADSWELSEHDAPTRPFDHVDAEELDDEAAVAAMAAAAAAAPAAPVSARLAAAAPPTRLPAVPAPVPATLDQTPSVEARFWADSGASDEGVDIDVALEEPAPIAVRATRRYAPRAQRHESTQIARMPQRAGRSWLWIGGAFVLGVAATAIIAWPRNHAAPAAPPPAVAAPTAPAPAVTPAPTPTVAPIVTPAPAPTVAPIAAAPAPEAVAPAPVAVAPAPVAEPEPAPVAEPEPAPVAPAPARPARTRAAPAPTRVASKPAPTRVASKPAPASTGGAALLMIGSKPPCDIVVDGKRTGLSTPQRALKLTPGPHKVTLVNKQYGINESFTVTAKVGAPVKVVKDLTAKMRR